MKDVDELKDKIETAVAILQWELASMWGHVSVRVPDSDRFVLRHLRPPASPRISPHDVLEYDMSGRLISGKRDQPDEIFFYLCPYQTKKQVGAVIHCHPPMAIALTAIGKKIVPIHQRMAGFRSQIPVAPWLYGYWRKDGELAVRKMGKSCALMIEGHGAIVTGETIEEACMNMVELERAAKMILLAGAQGKVRAMPPAKLKKFQTIVGSKWKDTVSRGSKGGLVEWMEWNYYAALVRKGERWSKL
jgi:L-fuculose-phosphate aldolase